MEQTFLTSVDIAKVRHLQKITIPLSSQKRKHLIFTGKNGSGKTSVLDAIDDFLSFVVGPGFFSKEKLQDVIDFFKDDTSDGAAEESEHNQAASLWEDSMHHWTDSASASCTSFAALREKYANGQYILAYYRANRKSNVEISNTIENVQLEEKYASSDTPGTKLVKYMVGLKATQAFALQKKDNTRAAEIDAWFVRFEGILKKIFEDPTLQLDFDIENFQFRILQKNREPFDFNTMSSGYSAVFDIINDLIMRMERKGNYEVEGIVLVDEIETHLHLELQKIILPFLTELFPNIQFIVSTHSPFILSSIENAVIYDLETQELVENGLANFPYDGIVEGYFHTDQLSNDFRKKLNRYKALIQKTPLTDEDYAELVELEQALDEIPDYLSPEIASEYSRLKLEFLNRG